MKNLKFKKFLSLLLVFIMMAGILGGCGKKEDSEEKNAGTNNVSTEEKVATKDEAESHIVTDHAGHEVEVPNKIEKIVIDQVPILSTYMAYNEGKAPYIVGYAGSLKQVISETVLKDMAPELLDATNTVQGQSDINVEEIMKLKPDVIFYNAKNQDRYEKLSKTGVPCIGFVTMGADTPADPINRYGEWLKLLEDVFGEKGKMDDFLKAGDDIVKDVEERIASVPEDKRPSGMILWKYQEGTPIVAGKGTFGDFWLKRLKVKNVAEEAKGYAKVNVEQIYSWNPDVFYLDGPGLLNIKTEDVYNNSVEGFDFSNLKSVKDKRVYNSKLGMWNWLTPNPDAPLVLAWLASETYPDAFKDYDLKKVIKDYYQKWYNYELTDEQIEDMFNI
ncbi:MAG: ABC transporter substrate-binding protein [Peptoniphilus grossensis]|uniref:ABC transporter substrate-binding protein n=1 Tax=Peptoniphilus grossensis TaxID=1465756 RepID=UPI00258450A0|nr:ABC transporter substrate-binding protein [Peptoniphilus grossensis]MDU5099043.1 ABC transporter substrate-binding protein [Peptoniphilus grossensis]